MNDFPPQETNSCNQDKLKPGIPSIPAKATPFTPLTISPHQWKALPPWLLRQFSLYSLLAILSGVLLNLFSPIGFSLAHAESSADIVAVPLNNSNTSYSSNSFAVVGTGIRITARGNQVPINYVAPTLSVGDVLVISIIHVGSGPNDQFGIKWRGEAAYPYTSFVKIDGNTAYYKCLNAYCKTGTVAYLQNDADYMVYAHAITNGQLNAYKPYFDSFSNWMSIIANNLINVNNSVADNTKMLDSKIDGVYTWFRSLSVSVTNNHDELMKKLDEFMNSPSQQQAAQELSDREKAEELDSSGKEQQDAVENAEFTENSQNVISAAREIALAPSTNCVIKAPGKVPLDMDFCRTPRPSFLAPLIAIPSAIAGIILSLRIIKLISAEIQSFRAGL